MSYQASQADSQGGDAQDLDTGFCRGEDLLTDSIEQWTAEFQGDVSVFASSVDECVARCSSAGIWRATD